MMSEVFYRFDLNYIREEYEKNYLNKIKINRKEESKYIHNEEIEAIIKKNNKLVDKIYESIENIKIIEFKQKEFLEFNQNKNDIKVYKKLINYLYEVGEYFKYNFQCYEKLNRLRNYVLENGECFFYTDELLTVIDEELSRSEQILDKIKRHIPKNELMYSIEEKLGEDFYSIYKRIKEKQLLINKDTFTCLLKLDKSIIDVYKDAKDLYKQYKKLSVLKLIEISHLNTVTATIINDFKKIEKHHNIIAEATRMINGISLNYNCTESLIYYLGNELEINKMVSKEYYKRMNKEYAGVFNKFLDVKIENSELF